MAVSDAEVARGRGNVWDYLAILRLDHSTKHIFIIPGLVIAFILRGSDIGIRHESLSELGIRIFFGVLAAVCIASANYAINEFLDRDFDRFHPTKSQRVSVQRELDGRIVALIWFVLAAVGIGAASRLGGIAFWVGCIFVMQGVVYNVRPIRTKDKAYLDVISESINNPLRFLLGWTMIDGTTLAPASIILAYWFGGAFLMAAKRLSEYREITASHGKELLTRYRASFYGYTERSLTVSCLVYSLLSSFFLAVFLMKYRIEYILLIPVVTILFGQYLAISMVDGSSAQSPEKLYREKGLMLITILLAVTFVLTTLFDIPGLNALTEQRYIKLW